MKSHLILIALAVLMFIIATPRAHALFGHVAVEKERRLEAEQHLTQEEQSNAHLHIVISVLSATAVGALVIGATVGSKTRRDANQP